MPLSRNTSGWVKTGRMEESHHGEYSIMIMEDEYYYEIGEPVLNSGVKFVPVVKVNNRTREGTVYDYYPARGDAVIAVGGLNDQERAWAKRRSKADGAC